MNFKNDHHLTVAKIAPLIRARKISPVELADFFLGRISRFNPSLNAFLTVTVDFARKQARRAEREIAAGRYRGPLHGIPISLKDLFYTRGIRTTAGSKILRNFIPKENASVVEKLFQAGAVLLGKTHLHEFAFGVTNLNPHFGPAHNPWDLNRVPGGSSGGSAAAISAGLCLATLGTDTGGSIRIPSSACGVVGLKPTRGLISLDGVVPLASSLDHAGPIARCAADAGILLNILAEETPGKGKINYLRNLRDPIRGLRIGVPHSDFFERAKKDVRETTLQALKVFKKLGARIQEVDLKGAPDAGRVFATTVIAEALAFHWDWISSRPQDYGSDLRERMEQNKNQATVVYLKAQEERRTIRRVFDEVLKRVDVVAIPTLPIVAPGLEEKEIKIGSRLEMVRTVLLRFTPPANLTGLPAISLPCGFSRENMPIGLQLLGRGFEEATLLRVAYAYEQATPWHEMFPTDKFEDAVRPGSPNPSLPGPVDRPRKSSDRFA